MHEKKLSISILHSLRLHKILIAAATYIIILIMMFTATQTRKYDLNVDDICPADIYAPRDIVDKLSTEKQREAAAARVPEQYLYDNAATIAMERNLSQFFSDISKIRTSEDEEEDEQKLENAQTRIKITLEDEALLSLLRLSSSDFALVETETSSIHKGLFSEGITNVEAAVESVDLSNLTPELADIAAGILSGSLIVNKSVDVASTEQERERARATVEPVTYKKSEVIVRRGEKLKSEQQLMLAELGFLSANNAFNYKQIASQAAILLTLMAIVIMYIMLFKRRLIDDRSKLIILSITVILSVALSAFTGSSEGVNVYITPIAITPILVSILLDFDLSIIINVCVCVLACIITKGDFVLAFSMMTSGLFSAMIFKKATMRNLLVYSGVLVCIVNFLIFSSFAMLEVSELSAAGARGLAGVLNGLICVLFVIGSMPFWEITFDVITPFKLYELANPNQRLMRRMLTEAPGTYHHSLMVGNLAESAADAIGANPLLTRVGAYYHDIGKLKNPSFFKENQYNENPHDQLDPYVSAGAVISHVSSGLELAKQYRLPSIIRDVIEQHHGTTTTAFFYHKAKQLGGGEVDEAKFRYDGPRPHNKEAVLVMLADVLEATIRSIDDKSDDVVESTVRTMIQQRVSEGQLDNADITLADLESIVQSFCKTFNGYFHHRIQYPTEIGGKKRERN